MLRRESGIQNLAAAIAKGQKDGVLSVILSKMEELTKEKEALKKKLAQMQDAGRAAGFDGLDPDKIAGSLGALNDSTWDLMNAADKRNMIKSMVDKIIWDGKKLDMVLFGSKYTGTGMPEPESAKYKPHQQNP